MAACLPGPPPARPLLQPKHALACAKPSPSRPWPHTPPPGAPSLTSLLINSSSFCCQPTVPSQRRPVVTALSTGRCCHTLSHHADVFLCVTPLVRTDVVLLIYLLVHPPSSLGRWALRRQPPAAPAPSSDRSSRIQGILVPLFQHKTDKRGPFPYS